MMDLTCAAPEEGAGSGEQPEEWPKRPEAESERLNVKPKRRKGRNGKGEREKDRPDSATKTLSTLCCTDRQQHQQQQQQQPQQRGPFNDEFLASSYIVHKTFQECFNGKESIRSINSDEDVGSGAAVQAAILTDVGSSQAQGLLLADTNPSSTDWRRR